MSQSQILEHYGHSDFMLVILVCVVLILVTVLFHYEVLKGITLLLAKPRHGPRVRILYMVLGLTMLHTLEILIFAAGYKLLSLLDLGMLSGMPSEHFYYYFYYSAVSYTTLGFGDIIPLGPLKLLTAMEALLGLGFITWSASFTFLEMQKLWNVNKV
ncbi:MAG: potassium channel family protein [Gammaproteobacteria bacterium]